MQSIRQAGVWLLRGVRSLVGAACVHKGVHGVRWAFFNLTGAEREV